MSVRVPQRILVAPSGFKESLDAVSVATAIATFASRSAPIGGCIVSRRK